MRHLLFSKMCYFLFFMSNCCITNIFESQIFLFSQSHEETKKTYRNVDCICWAGRIRSRVFFLTEKSLDPVSRCSPFLRRFRKTYTSLRLSHPNESQAVDFLRPKKISALQKEHEYFSLLGR